MADRRRAIVPAPPALAAPYHGRTVDLLLALTVVVLQPVVASEAPATPGDAGATAKAPAGDEAQTAVVPASTGASDGGVPTPVAPFDTERPPSASAGDGETSAAAPLDTEVPEPAGMGLQMREYRQLEALTGLDLAGAWESYEDDVRDGETEPFVAFARRRFKIRRNIGIVVTCWGIAALGPATYFGVEAARTELYEGKGLLGFAAAATSAVAVSAIITGAFLWRHWAAPLRDLRDAGLARARPSLAPLVVPRGLGVGLRLAF